MISLWEIWRCFSRSLSYRKILVIVKVGFRSGCLCVRFDVVVLVAEVAINSRFIVLMIVVHFLIILENTSYLLNDF